MNRKYAIGLNEKTRYILGLMLIMVICLAGAVFADPGDSQIITVSLINQDPDPASAGNIVELRIGVENNGGESAENVILELVPQYPFEMVPGESPVQEIGTIKPYLDSSDMKIVKFRLRVDRDANEGQYGLEIWEYEEGKRDKVRVEKTITIDVANRESAEIIYIDKVELVPGRQTNMKFTINNVGSAPLRDLTFSWENEDDVILPVGSDNTKYIKYLDVSEKTELSYDVIADSNAEPGLYKLMLSLKYDDSITGVEKEIATIAGVYVGGETDFDVAFSESSMGEYSFSIANIGCNPAYSVSVIVPEQKNWKVSGSNSAIIGNLNKGDYTVASFSLQQSGPPPSLEQDSEVTDERKAKYLSGNRTMPDDASNTIEIEIAYTDTMGARKTVNNVVSINANSETDAMSARLSRGGNANPTQNTITTTHWIALGLGLIIVVVLYRRHRKKKLK
ncbi:MAG: COG1361 S-layer family protein [Candidatus Aenigmarchaeota archaeon]|nr:COG1361 S-layer family protein [Candidatus Aenigmarchaeota archaeon]